MAWADSWARGAEDQIEAHRLAASTVFKRDWNRGTEHVPALVCEKHDVVECSECWEVSRKLSAKCRDLEEIKKRRDGLIEWRELVRGPRGEFQKQGGLGGLAHVDYADFGNSDFLSRLIPVVFEAWRDWDYGSMFISAGTGAGKTRGFDARIHEDCRTLWSDAKIGPITLPPRIVYATGYDIGEAAKRRRLGEPPEEIVKAALRARVLVLDEIHSLHTPLPELFGIIDVREREGLPTVLTTGMTIREFGGWVGAAALRRVMSGKVVDGFAKGGK